MAPSTWLRTLINIRWLKSHWILLSEGESEIKESIALSFGRSVALQMPTGVIKDYIDVSLHDASYVARIMTTCCS